MRVTHITKDGAPQIILRLVESTQQVYVEELALFQLLVSLEGVEIGGKHLYI